MNTGTESTRSRSNADNIGRLLRMLWMLVGNIVLYVLWIAIVFTSAPLPSVLDAAVWATVVLMLVVRRLDIARHAGRTLENEPASLADWRRYVAFLVGAALAGEVVAHQLGGTLLRA